MLLARELTEQVIGLAIDRLPTANILPAHDAQVLTYLRMSGLRLGLLFNFHARLLKDGLRRFVRLNCSVLLRGSSWSPC